MLVSLVITTSCFSSPALSSIDSEMALRSIMARCSQIKQGAVVAVFPSTEHWANVKRAVKQLLEQRKATRTAKLAENFLAAKGGPFVKVFRDRKNQGPDNNSEIEQICKFARLGCPDLILCGTEPERDVVTKSVPQDVEVALLEEYEDTNAARMADRFVSNPYQIEDERSAIEVFSRMTKYAKNQIVLIDPMWGKEICSRRKEHQLEPLMSPVVLIADVSKHKKKELSIMLLYPWPDAGNRDKRGVDLKNMGQFKIEEQFKASLRLFDENKCVLMENLTVEAKIDETRILAKAGKKEKVEKLMSESFFAVDGISWQIAHHWLNVGDVLLGRRYQRRTTVRSTTSTDREILQQILCLRRPASASNL